MGIEAKLPSGLGIWVTKLANWGRQGAVYPLTAGLACCAIEMMSMSMGRYDISRFGMEAFRATPRQADLLIVSGRVSKKMAPVLRRLYDQMPDPKWVIAMGDCASCGGVFNNYAILQGVDKILPVDFFVPGCPPRPEALLEAIVKLRQKIRDEGTSMAGSDPVVEMLSASLGDALLGIDEDRAGSPLLIVDRGSIRDACRLLRDEGERFVHLSGIWGVDYLDMGLEPRFAVVYFLYSPTSKRRVGLKVPLEEGDAVVPSVVDIFPGANWHERETFDMFGIQFQGHPNLERILMPEDATEYPLRKDFPLGEEEIEFSHNTEKWQRIRESEYPRKSPKSPW